MYVSNLICQILSAAESGWELVVDEGTLQMFTQPVDPSEAEVIPVDPLKAVMTIQGVTAKEVCHYFWDVAYRMEWDHAAEKPPTILELPAQSTMVQHQTYKRVWPTVQREAVFWSHLCQRGDLWIVANHSTDHKAPPLEESKRVRLRLNVAMVCRMEEAAKERSQLRCRMQYTAQLHPGGWAPQSIIRSVQRREFPHFLRRFSAYVQEKTKDLPVDL